MQCGEFGDGRETDFGSNLLIFKLLDLRMVTACLRLMKSLKGSEF